MDQRVIEAQFNAAIAAFQRQDFEAALTAIDQVLGAGIQVRGAAYIKAVCEVTLGRFQNVLTCLHRELQLFPDNQDAVQLKNQVLQIAASNPTIDCISKAPAKVLLCGLAPGESGTGRFLSSLLPVAARCGYSAVHSNAFGFHAAEKLAIATLRNATILIMHPQTISWELVKSLFDGGNKLRFYVLDNSLFCIRSFNYRPEKTGECLDCVGNVDNCSPGCAPFPEPVDKGKNLDFLRWLQRNSPSFEFFCQSDAQRDLVIRHFGPETKAVTVGMIPSDLGEGPVTQGVKYDMVFHADSHAAKGLHYSIELARLIPERSLFVPCSAEALQRSGFIRSIPPNVTVQDVRWTSGLREIVAAAGLVMCPSQWSAAVEGALLKSLQVNGNVAVYESAFGFSRELPGDVALHLSADLEASAARVREFLLAGTNNKERANSWLRKYIDSVTMERIFA